MEGGRLRTCSVRAEHELALAAPRSSRRLTKATHSFRSAARAPGPLSSQSRRIAPSQTGSMELHGCDAPLTLSRALSAAAATPPFAAAVETAVAAAVVLAIGDDSAEDVASFATSSATSDVCSTSMVCNDCNGCNGCSTSMVDAVEASAATLPSPPAAAAAVAAVAGGSGGACADGKSAGMQGIRHSPAAASLACTASQSHSNDRGILARASLRRSSSSACCAGECDGDGGACSSICFLTSSWHTSRRCGSPHSAHMDAARRATRRAESTFFERQSCCPAIGRRVVTIASEAEPEGAPLALARGRRARATSSASVGAGV